MDSRFDAPDKKSKFALLEDGSASHAYAERVKRQVMEDGVTRENIDLSGKTPNSHATSTVDAKKVPLLASTEGKSIESVPAAKDDDDLPGPDFNYYSLVDKDISATRAPLNPKGRASKIGLHAAKSAESVAPIENIRKSQEKCSIM